MCVIPTIPPCQLNARYLYSSFFLFAISLFFTVVLVLIVVITTAPPFLLALLHCPVSHSQMISFPHELVSVDDGKPYRSLLFCSSTTPVIVGDTWLNPLPWPSCSFPYFPRFPGSPGIFPFLNPLTQLVSHRRQCAASPGILVPSLGSFAPTNFFGLP